MFTNAKKVMIGNKEVESIVTSNGGVIYQKSSGYELSLVSNDYSISVGNSTNLTATLTNNNVPVSGETIKFYEGATEYNDPCTSDNTSQYTISYQGTSYSFTYDNNSYLFSNGSYGGSGYLNIEKSFLSLNNCSMECELSISQPTSPSECGIKIYSSDNSVNEVYAMQLCTWSSDKYVGVYENGDWEFSSNRNMWTDNTYYKLKFILNNNQLTGYIYNSNNELVYSYQFQISSSIAEKMDTFQISVANASTTNGDTFVGNVKNILITPLNNNSQVFSSIGSGVTDSNGVVTKSYTPISNGTKNILAKHTECDNSIIIQTKRILLEDNTEHTYTQTGSRYPNVIGDFQTSEIGDFDLTFKYKSSGYARFYMGSKASFTQPTANPSNGIFIGGDTSVGNFEYGYVQSASRAYQSSVTLASDTYYNIHITRVGSTVTFYSNDTLVGTVSAGYLSNVQDLCLALVYYGGGASRSIKDILLQAI